jgi:hypothetical protein
MEEMEEYIPGAVSLQSSCGNLSKLVPRARVASTKARASSTDDVIETPCISEVHAVVYYNSDRGRLGVP